MNSDEVMAAGNAAAGTVPVSPVHATTPPQMSNVVKNQAYIWVSFFLAFALLMTLCVLCQMDPDKSQDSLLYAKFIANTDKKHN
jgi:hypothetical protein